MSITCKGAVCWGLGEPLVVEDIEVEPPRTGEVRVRIMYASICHTDILLWNGFPLELFPRVTGHEGVGMIESLGEGVTDLKEGDIVIPTFIGECKQCLNCTSNMTNVCLKYPLICNGLMLDETSRMSAKGKKLYHCFSCSTFAEFTVVNTNYITKIDPKVPLSHASLLSCGFSTGYGAVWKEAKIREGSSVAVLGLGGVGLGVVAGAKLLGAKKIIGVDLKTARKELAVKLGVTDFVNPSDFKNKSISEVIKYMTEGLGVDYSFECSGAPLVNEAFCATIPGRGVTIVVGSSRNHTTEINTMELFAGKTLKGSIFGGIKPQSELPTVAEKCINKELQLDGFVTHEFELSDINKALEVLKKPECLKVLIKLDHKQQM